MEERMTKYEFAAEIQAIKITWHKIYRVMDNEAMRTKHEKELAEAVTKVYEQLRAMELDGHDLNEIWIQNPVPNEEPWEALHRRTDWLIDQYEALSDKLIAAALREAEVA